MCGICGLVLRDRTAVPDPAVVDEMTDILRHRGPDDRGVEIFGNVALGNRRLAVIDLEGGHQPMSGADGRLWITYNGELFNYLELRADLLQRGYRLRTHSDTEVLLYLYSAYGLGMFERMNGMFAFALYDRDEHRILLARDRFGEKPLYWYRDDEKLVFASEIKSILRAPGLEARPDWAAVHEYLTFQYCIGEKTLFEGIRKLRPASYLLLDDTGRTLDEGDYWSLSFEEDHSTSEASFIDELRFLIEDAVKIRLRSDVPVGTYLSGGLDSSVVSSMAAKLMGGGLPSFTGYFDGDGFSEVHYAQAVVEQNGGEHHLIRPTPADFEQRFRQLIWHMDEPAAGPGAFPQLVVSDLASGHVKVVLGGQGGDEIFGGYARYLILYLEESLKGSIFGSQDPSRHIVTLDRALGNLALLQGYVPLLKRFWSEGLFDEPERRYYSLVARAHGVEGYLDPDFLELRDEEALYAEFEQEFNEILRRVPSHASALFNRMTSYDARTMLQSLLHVEDRMSMAVSLESRLPFLDHRIAELMFRMPPRYKYRDGQSKAALLTAAGTFVPRAVRERQDKMGFPVPFVEWARSELRPFVTETLLGEAALERGVYRPEGVAELIAGEVAYGRELWGLLCLETWFQTFVDE